MRWSGGLKAAPSRGAASWTIDIPLTLILLGSAALRFIHLPYSHFQGDEIKALYPPGEAFPDFLFSQGKGPIQYLVTILIGWATGGYVEWVTRLPFALASLVAVYVVYRLVHDVFERSVALMSAALFGTCGLVAAFGRVVQYQSFCILFILLTAHFLFMWLRKSNPLLLYPGLLFYALALLTHWDALAFAPALVAILVAGRSQHRQEVHADIKHLAIAGLMGAVIVGGFYIPYVLEPNFTARYLLGRIASGKPIQETFASVYGLLGLYLPPLYMAVTIPSLIYGVSLLLRNRRSIPCLIFAWWFISVFAFYMLLGGDPRTHVYNYFLPGLVLVAFGLDGLIKLAGNPGQARTLRTGVWVLIVGFALATYTMLVDHTVEHPWYRKTILGYPLPNVETRRIAGVFGFPYQRALPEVGVLFQSGQLTGSFDSNERDVMADYYFRTWRASPPDYYIYVHHPMSLYRNLPAFVSLEYRWIREILVDGRKVIDIYKSP
jgi:4-amino-4-deoxy-L-arabinose transferase-like glycosyltransferase